ncbi:MAG: pantoate--beta-alanine ligase [Bacteroidia bacterium]
MITVTTRKDLQDYLPKAADQSIGFVPTMGALHQGHISLLKRAKSENDIGIASIFINPIQFNDINDFNRYPRNFEADKQKLERNGCDLLFLPDYEEIYPGKEIEWIDPDLGYIEQVMEGQYRPGHFKGVKTVVYHLLNIVKPARAYFGKKDYQQMLIIKSMIRVMNLPVEVVPCDTERERDELAMSSRNKTLNSEERHAAAKIPMILNEALERLKDHKTQEVKAWVNDQFLSDPTIHLEYFEILDQESLKPVDRAVAGKTRLFIAAYPGKIRLIDNMLYKG